ncbi:(-)-delta-cadinene synthase [Colletotrichum chlorophyti]|uniref:Terpene synthase n=1 Tax=Colletotrichum chlorophyti TaxID=708187 RepID=A0A1Q8S3V8_9PEZI|nr:(-)-delta-cadinene synthase [Colletotrichum chlorophyti]
MAGYTESAQLASRLDGQVMIIPDLRGMLAHWPSGENVHGPDIEAHINGILDRTASGTDKANVMEANPALLASWLKKLATLTMMVLWQGRLDDYIETLEYKSPNKAKEFHSRAKEYIAKYLQLSEGPRDDSSTPVIGDFEMVAQIVCRGYGKDQRRRLRISLFDYLDSTVQEMRYIQAGRIPVKQVYESLRRKTGGAGPLCALAEYAAGVQLSATIIDSKPFGEMLRAVSIIIGLTNDLLSLGKELRNGRTLSMVPVLLWNDKRNNLNSVVEDVVEDIRKAVKEFDVLENRLIHKYAAEAEDIRKVTTTFKTICTGNLAWRQVLLFPSMYRFRY